MSESLSSKVASTSKHNHKIQHKRTELVIMFIVIVFYSIARRIQGFCKVFIVGRGNLFTNCTHVDPQYVIEFLFETNNLALLRT